MPILSEHWPRRFLMLQAGIAGLALSLMMVSVVGHAHTDLQLQVDELSAQLARDPDNVELLLRRGDLQRRHENWDLARADFKHVRGLQPANETVDWFEGRLEVQAGQAVEGVRCLDRFLSANPGHLIALQDRAQGYLSLDQPLLAANDYQAVISASESPAPSLYRASALALIRAGDEHYSTAMEVLLAGLSNFPAEVTLTAIATDLSLALSDTVVARKLMIRLPEPVLALPQWRTRNALLECQSGFPQLAAVWFSGAVEKSRGTGQPPGLLSWQWLARLAAEPGPGNCQAAAIDILDKLRD